MSPRARRLCRAGPHPSQPGKPYCLEHQREADAARGSAAARGYGPEHRRRRAELLRTVDGTACPVCHEPLHRDGAGPDALELAHRVPLRVNPDQLAGDALVHRRCNDRGTSAGNYAAQLW